MCKVIIINSPLFAEKKAQYEEDSLPPIGLGYIATQLRKLGHRVQLVDAVAENRTPSELLDIIHTARPDAVALNIFTTNFKLTQALVEGISDKAIRMIIGGLSTRTLYKDIFAWNTPNNIDVVFGDGDLITGALVSSTEIESPFESVAQRRFFSVGGNSQYFVADISGLLLDRDFFTNEPTVNPQGFKEISIITGRGCIFNCAFCAAARSINTEMPVREMTEEAVIRDLDAIRESYPDVVYIRILDDLFLKGAESIKKAVRIFDRCKYQWRSMAHVQTFLKADVSEIRSLYKHGCRELFVGVESGSPQILRKFHKTHDIDVIKRSLRSVMEVGIGLKTYFIYGFPGETKKDFVETYALAESLRCMAFELKVPFRTSVFQFRPYHGTEIYDELQSQGRTDDVKNVSPDAVLSSLIGRDQFNFGSGNYSAEKTDIVHDFITRTIELKVCPDEK